MLLSAFMIWTRRADGWKFALSNVSYAFPDTPFSASTVLDTFAIRTLADFAGVGLFYAFHMQKGEAHSRLEKDYLHKLLQNYRVSAESVDLINRKYHDLKHQIQLLRSGIGQEEKLHYLDEMEREIQSYEAQNKTGNKALDTTLTAKTLRCQGLGISLTCVADGRELDFIKPTDLSVLFGNALDNAIESVEKIVDVEKRLIHGSVARQKTSFGSGSRTASKGRSASPAAFPPPARTPAITATG